MVFDRRHSIIFGYHSFKSVAFSKIFSFSLAVKRLMILVFPLLCLFFSMPNVFFFTF